MRHDERLNDLVGDRFLSKPLGRGRTLERAEVLDLVILACDGRRGIGGAECYRDECDRGTGAMGVTVNTALCTSSWGGRGTR